MKEKPPARKGIARLYFACIHSFAGLKTALGESAFQQEMFLYVILGMVIFFMNVPSEQKWILLAVNTMVLIIEIVNTALETVVDLVSPGYSELAGRAKDLGSAAVLLSLLLAGGTWIWILI